MAEVSKARRMAQGMRAALILGAWLWAWSACTQPDPDDRQVGSGTELGNVMGILVTPGRQAAAGVAHAEVHLARSVRKHPEA